MTVRCRTDDRVATLTIDRPTVRNALDATTLTDLANRLGELEHSRDIRCVVLDASGPVFCSGGDLREIRDLGPVGVRDFLHQRVRPLIHRMLTMTTPVVASLDGPVAGAGLSLVLAADFAVASPRADVIPAFMGIGAVPDGGALALAVHKLGLARAKQLFLLVDRLPAAVAESWGFYTVCTDEVAEATAEVAGRLAELAPLAVGYTKMLAREAGQVPFDTYLDAEAAAQALMHASKDHREGIAAFLEKRPPQFLGV
jgi:2-(1,2-epoxy-1,2-dihydrophenyl)acetyl-CoA isomerase